MILIKGMEMPKNCGECPMICDDDLCRITKGGRTIKERPPHCPLIELPPHGRLIDADAAMKAACEALCHLGVFCPDNLCKEVRETFDAVPTIIESEKEDG